MYESMENMAVASSEETHIVKAPGSCPDAALQVHGCVHFVSLEAADPYNTVSRKMKRSNG